MSSAVGFYLGSADAWTQVLLIHLLLGTALVAGGTSALNQWMERDADARMRRTQDRPLPAGRLEPRSAFWFGAALSAAGTAYLALAVNVLTGSLAAFTCLSYLLGYTPLKSRTPLSTFVGAFPGAMPILMGWTGARNQLSIEGWILYGLLFLWQFPHFLAIATLYREDYQRAGIRMLPVIDPDGTATGRRIVAYTAALLLLSAAPALVGLNGNVYLFGALALGLAFLYCGVQMARRHTKIQARRLLQASVFYLPLVYGLMVLDKL
jgi:protoheme IX farnesyltransferase